MSLVRYFVGKKMIAEADGAPPPVGAIVWFEDQRTIPGSRQIKMRCMRCDFVVHRLPPAPGRGTSHIEVSLRPVRRVDRENIEAWCNKEISFTRIHGHFRCEENAAHLTASYQCEHCMMILCGFCVEPHGKSHQIGIKRR